MNEIGIILIYFITFFSVTGFFLMMPYISRKNISFGVNIPESEYNSNSIKVIRKQYRNSGTFWSAIIILSTILLSTVLDIPDIEIILVAPSMLLELLVFSFVYLHAYHRMKSLKEKSTWHKQEREVIVIDTDFRKKRITISPIWFASYLLVIIVTLGLGFYFFEQAPHQIPLKFDFDGHVYNTIEKSYKVILFGPMVQLFLTMIFAFSYWVIGKSKQQIDAANSEASIKQNRIFRYRWSLFVVFGGLLLLLLFTFMELVMLGVIKDLVFASIVSMVFPTIFVIAVVFLSITTGQSGNRIHVYANKENQKITVNRDDDAYWKLGSLYYNPEDPSLFIEKRFGIGWTLNWGRPMSWVIIIGLIALIIGFYIFITLLTK